MGFRRNPTPLKELRALAQQRLQKRGAHPEKAFTLLEAQQLLEELEIHQIELELQNEHLNATRQQLEAALHESSALYDFSPMGGLSLDRTGTITRLNLASARLLGAERARLVGTALATHVAQKDRAVLETLLQQAVYSGDSETGELALESGPDGLNLLVELRVSLSSDTLGWQIAMADISERKRAEERMRASEARWKLAIDAAGDGMWAWDLPTGEVVFSSRVSYLLGYESKDKSYSMDDWAARIHPEDRSRVLAAHQAHLAGHTEKFSSEYRYQRQDGSWKWLLARGAIVSRTVDGRALRVIGTYTDIAERKRTEEALVQSLRFEQAVFEVVATQLAVVNSDGVVIRTNAAWCNQERELGLANGSAKTGSKYLDYLAHLTKHNIAVCEATAAGMAAVLHGKMARFKLPQPFFVVAGQHWLSLKVTPVGAAPNCVLVSHEDVTLLKTAELAHLQWRAIDPLTGALSKRQFLLLAERDIARAKRDHTPLMLLMMNLDHLRAVNDQFGHAMGDAVLQAFVITVTSVLRGSDLIGRVGGDVFAVLLYNTNEQGGAILGRRIIELMRSRVVEAGGKRATCKVSIGGCSLSNETSINALLQAADAPLRRAKALGRDRLELGQAPGLQPPASGSWGVTID